MNEGEKGGWWIIRFKIRFSTRKNFVFRLRWQRENGLMNRVKRRWFPKKPICEGGAKDFITVGLQEVKPALYLLIIGTSLSLILMFAEIVMHKATFCYNKLPIPHCLDKVHEKFMDKY